MHGFARSKVAQYLARPLVSIALTTFGIALSMPFQVRAQDQSDQNAALTVETAVRLALEHNPGLDELRHRAQAAAAVPSQAGSLPDPRISLGAMNLPVDSFVLDQEPMTQIQFGVSQMFPFPGTLGLKREMADFNAAAAANSVSEGRLRLVRDVRKHWWNLLYLSRATATIDRNRALLSQLVDVARTKYEIGKGLQQDVLLAQVELSRLQDMSIQIQGMRAAATARLNALMARPAQSAARLPETVDTHLPPVPDPGALLAGAETRRPLLAKARNQLDAADRAAALARKSYLPDFGVSAAYGWRQGQNGDGSERADFASAMFSVSVPLFAGAKQDQLVAQRRSEVAAREQALADARNAVQADISAALADYRRAHDEFVLLDTGILPQTTQAVASMQAGYQVSKVDFLTLIRTQITLYNHELQRWQALAQAHQALAQLAAAAGVENFDE